MGSKKKLTNNIYISISDDQLSQMVTFSFITCKHQISTLSHYFSSSANYFNATFGKHQQIVRNQGWKRRIIFSMETRLKRFLT